MMARAIQGFCETVSRWYHARISTGETTSSAGVSGSGDREVQELFDLLDQFCLNEQLRNLLRQFRPSEDDYPISGNREYLKTAVRKLFNSGHLPREKLEDILERAEENGRQHIFLYAPTTDATTRTLNNYAAMELSLLDGRTRAEAGLPKFQIHPSGVEIADMRREERAGTKYWTWTYKLYAGAERWEVAGKPEVRDNEKIVRYRLRYRREVILIKWHSFGLLEVRVPAGGSRKHLDVVRIKLMSSFVASIHRAAQSGTLALGSMSSAVATMADEFAAERPRPKAAMPGAISFGTLAPFPIPVKALDSEARSKDIKWIGVSGTDYDFDGYRVRVETDDDQEDMYESGALAVALKSVTDCKRLDAVLYLKDQAGSPEKLRVDFCPEQPNEIRIGSQTSPEAVEFVIRRVWERVNENAALPPSPVDAIVTDAPEESTLQGLDFDAVARTYPYLANAMSRLKKWVIEHPSADFIDPNRLQKELGTGLHGTDVAVAVAKLMEEGLIERKYRVRPAKRKQFIPQMFDSIDEVLDHEIRDTNGEVIDLHVAEVVPVYGKAGIAGP